MVILMGLYLSLQLSNFVIGKVGSTKKSLRYNPGLYMRTTDKSAIKYSEDGYCPSTCLLTGDAD